MKKLWIWFRNTTLMVILIIVGTIVFFLYQIFRAQSQLDAVPLALTNYQPAALELVKLCQSDSSFYTEKSPTILEPFDPAWAPPSVARLHPETIDVGAAGAKVYWGGGFYHCGWDLRRESGNTWTLTFTRENKPVNVLETITVPADEKFSKEEFVSYVLTEIDRRLAVQADDGSFTDVAEWYLAASRCLFLAQHHRVDLLPSEVRKSAASYPHDWRDVLLAYLVDHASNDPSAADKLRRWANQANGPTAWMYVAYAFYQGGDTASGDIATKLAIATTASDPAWIDGNSSEYQLAMAARLYRCGNFTACATLCDGILLSRHRSFTNATSVRNLSGWATATAASRPAELPVYDKFIAIDPFGGFDLELLTSHPRP